jgi:hypothetical protein
MKEIHVLFGLGGQFLPPNPRSEVEDLTFTRMNQW